jgi:hypothetical protein
MHQPFVTHLASLGRFAPFLAMAPILLGGAVLIFSSIRLRTRTISRRVEMVQFR